MSTSNLMSLPVDIVWKRLALDEEMMWKPPTSYPAILTYPPAWNPSITIFYAKPDPALVVEEYQEESITYLKVVCSLTGTTPVKGDPALSAWPANHPASKIISKNLTPYYGCYGAILEVDLEPFDPTGVSLNEYPYFLDLQPKKREIYESVTKSGETMSDSKRNLSVRKSVTSTEDMEISAGIPYPTYPEYKGTFGDEYTNVRNVDASREYREKYSHTTNLSQLYHQLNSYHVGTNRVLFLIQPRPHINDPEYQTFVGGPRRLEGIQEFFLVVIQPKTLKGLCVNAYLKTGHFAFGKIKGQPIQTKKKDLFQNYHHPAYTLDMSSPNYSNGYYQLKLTSKQIGLGWKINTTDKKTINWEQVKTDATPTMLGPGWKLVIDTTKSKRVDLIKWITVTTNAEGLTIDSSIDEYYEGSAPKFTKHETGEFYATLTVHLESEDISPSLSKDKEKIDFFVRNKSVGACLDKNGKINSRPTKTAYQDWTVMKFGPFPVSMGKAQSMNILSTQIIESMKDMNELAVSLVGPGPVSNPMHTDFVIQQFQESLAEVDDEEWLAIPLSQLAEISDEYKERLYENGIETRAQLLELTLDKLQSMLRLDNSEVRSMYLSAWDIPNQDQIE